MEMQFSSSKKMCRKKTKGRNQPIEILLGNHNNFMLDIRNPWNNLNTYRWYTLVSPITIRYLGDYLHVTCLKLSDHWNHATQSQAFQLTYRSRFDTGVCKLSRPLLSTNDVSHNTALLALPMLRLLASKAQ